MSVINTNYLALVAQGNLNKSQSALGSAIERLSSGLRINSAKDDAAGQAIANRFTAAVRGLTQASRNANDGISIAQTTEGALNEVNVHLQRINEQVVQALNGSNSPSDLDSIQAEINQRLADIDRISTQTDFNGVKVLAKDQALDLQVGAKDGERITINLREISANKLGLSGFNVTGPRASGTMNAVGTGETTKAYGNTTSITGASATVSNGSGLAAKLGVATGSVVATTGVVADDRGNWFVEVQLEAATATESENLKLRGFDIAEGSSGSYYIAVDPADATNIGTPGATNANFAIDL